MEYRILNDDSNSFNLDREVIYIISRSGTQFYGLETLLLGIDTHRRYCSSYLIDSDLDKELVIVAADPDKITLSWEQLFGMVETQHEIVVGYNPIQLREKDILRIYGRAGRSGLDSVISPLRTVYSDYCALLDQSQLTGAATMRSGYTGVMAGKTQEKIKYDPEKLKRVYYYNCGAEKGDPSTGFIEDFIKNNGDLMASKKCLVVSKTIKGYGGNQATARQLIQLLERHYIVRVLSLSLSYKKDYSFQTDSICPSIPNFSIVKIKRYSKVVDHINNTGYEFIVNNKLNEFFQIIPQIESKRIYTITHNSMDPFNRLIIDNQKFMQKVLTINKIHQTLLKKNGLELEMDSYRNYVKEQKKVPDRSQFTRKIVFVGRLSREKNVELLIHSFLKVVRQLPGLKLYIIGDGKLSFTPSNDSIVFTGKLDKTQIFEHLRGADYLILPSCTEGLPFTVLEAMSLGIPCICSNINGINEIIGHLNNGVLFDLKGYDLCKELIDSWKIYEETDKYIENNIARLANAIKTAYQIPVKTWNSFSQESHKLINATFTKAIACPRNLSLFC